jgi:hypothetical protein
MTPKTEIEHFDKPRRGFLGGALRAKRVTVEYDDRRVVEFYVDGQLIERRVEPIEPAVQK